MAEKLINKKHWDFDELYLMYWESASVADFIDKLVVVLSAEETKSED